MLRKLEMNVKYSKNEWRLIIKGYKLVWLCKLIGIKRILIDKGSWQKDFNIVVTPTIIIFVEGKETKRYQANIMMEIETKQTEVQDKIDEIIMELF